MEAYYHNQATMPLFSGHYRQRVSSEIYGTSSKTYRKRITCSSSTLINRFSNQEENAEQALKKHSTITIKKQVGAGRSKSHMSRKMKTATATSTTTTTTTTTRKRKGSHSKNRVPLRNRYNFFIRYKMISNLIPTEATHSSLDLFEKPPLLVTFENAFTQKIVPFCSPDSPMLEFEVLGDRNNFIDLQRTCLQIVARGVQNKGKVLQTHATETAQRDTPYLVNNPL